MVNLESLIPEEVHHKVTVLNLNEIPNYILLKTPSVNTFYFFDTLHVFEHLPTVFVYFSLVIEIWFHFD